MSGFKRQRVLEMSCSSDHQRAFEVNLLMVPTYWNLTQVMELSHTVWTKFLWGLKTRRFAPKITWYSISSSEFSMHDSKFDPIISANFLKCILCISCLFNSSNLFTLHLLPLNHILTNTVSRRGPILLEEGAQKRIFPCFIQVIWEFYLASTHVT